MSETDQNKKYDASSIKVLKGLDAVRKRPGMYIGDTDDGSGLHHMIYEAVDNAVDEALAGHCDTVTITLFKDGSASVQDNGRGIPVDIHPEEGISAAEVIMTQLHSGGKFDQNSYKVSGGLHGVGVSVVNALSTWLELRINREGKEHFLRFNNGVAEKPIEVLGDSKVENGEIKRGTEIRFLPSPETFTKIEFDFKTLEDRVRQLAFLNSNVRFLLIDKRKSEEVRVEMMFEGGLQAFVNHLSQGQSLVHENVISFSSEKDGITASIAMQWNDSYTENMLCFTNNIPQRDGGTHLAGFRSALTRVVNHYLQASGVIKKTKAEITGDDAREGLTFVLSVKVPDPKFSSQTKDKLVSSEVRSVVENITNSGLSQFFEENPATTKIILSRIVRAAEARESSRKARDISSKKSMDIAASPSKIAACSSNDPEKCEILIVEGDSAGGSAKQARDRATQAVLPLRGKILNVERVKNERVLDSEEIGNIILALGTGFGEADFNADKCRYHKIIIMTDADVDGSHIRTLILTFLFRKMPELISRGYVYIAQPPLFKTKRGNQEIYHKDQDALDNFLFNIAIDEGSVFKTYSGEQISNKDLSSMVKKARTARNSIKNLEKYVPSFIIEPALISGALNPNILDGGDFSGSINEFTMLLNKNNEGYSVNIEPSVGLVISRVFRRVEERHIITEAMLKSADNTLLQTYQDFIKNMFNGAGELTAKDGNVRKIIGLVALLDTILEIGKKGISLQRYKGLGEMNPEQLWETTLDPNARTLLQVSVNDAEQAEQVFSTLMGDLVPPRREFIETNALNVTNLDV